MNATVKDGVIYVKITNEKTNKVCEIPTNLTKGQFELALRQYMDDEGYSYDGFTLGMSWFDYQGNPEKFNKIKPYLKQKKKRKKKK